MGSEKIDPRNIELIDCFITEKELIERLITPDTDNKIHFKMFSNLLADPIGREEYLKYDGFYILTNTLREHLGFTAGRKPGDIDILIIPYCKTKIYFEKTCAYEVKVVRPTRKNPRKAPNSYGTTQIQGLIEDGFPMIGLIHICMTEPLKENEKPIIKFYTNPSEFVNVKMDFFACFSMENQMRRLFSKDIPKYVGLCAVGVNVTKEGNLFVYHNYNPTHERKGYFNPHKKQSTIDAIEKYWNINREKFIDAKR